MAFSSSKSNYDKRQNTGLALVIRPEKLMKLGPNSFENHENVFFGRYPFCDFQHNYFLNSFVEFFFLQLMDGRTHGRTDQRTDGRTVGRSDDRTECRMVGRTDGRLDGRTVDRTDGRSDAFKIMLA